MVYSPPLHDPLQILKEISQKSLREKINPDEINKEISELPREEIISAMKKIPKNCEKGFEKVGKLKRYEKGILCLIEKLSEGEKTQDIKERISFLRDFFWVLLEKRDMAFQEGYRTVVSQKGIILRKKQAEKRVFVFHPIRGWIPKTLY